MREGREEGLVGAKDRNRDWERRTGKNKKEGQEKGVEREGKVIKQNNRKGIREKKGNMD